MKEKKREGQVQDAPASRQSRSNAARSSSGCATRARSFHTRKYKRGAVIMEAGKAIDRCCVIVAGAARSAPVQRLRRDGEWGSRAELLALARVLRRGIRVATPFGADEYGAEEGAATDTERGRAPLQLHLENNHYRVAVPTFRPPPKAVTYFAFNWREIVNFWRCPPIFEFCSWNSAADPANWPKS